MRLLLRTLAAAVVATTTLVAVAVPVGAAEAGPRVIARKLADGWIEGGVRTADREL